MGRSLKTYDWGVAIGALVAVLTLIQPWYLAGTELKLGAQTGVLAVVGAAATTAAAVALLGKATDRFVIGAGRLTTEQVALLLALAGFVLIGLRVAFKPDFGFRTLTIVETTATPFIAVLGAGVALASTWLACRESPAGLPFRGVLRATSTPDPTLAAAPSTPLPAHGPNAGWHADPSGRFTVRYFDGADWTAHVSTGDQQFVDPSF